MLTTGFRPLCRTGLIALMLVAARGVGAQTPAPPAAAALPPYETEFEAGNGLSDKIYRVLFDNGRYRMEYNQGWQPHGALPLKAGNDVTEIYDNISGCSWMINEYGKASSTLSSIHHAYYVAAQKEGPGAYALT